jgi:mono/diheme cytochrome c family protein
MPHSAFSGPTRHALGVALLVIVAGSVGCGKEQAASFTPSAEVVALTDDIDDPEELELYKKLQSQIGEVLAARYGSPSAPKLSDADESELEHLARGAAIYKQYCVQCHGVNGDGRGELALHLDPAPRDYTQGVFKFATTSNGTPRRSDLINTVRRGVRGTSMPSFATHSDDELGAVIDYVLWLTQRGLLQKQLAAIAFEDGELPAKEDLDGVVDEILAPWVEANSSVVSPLTPMPEFTPESVALGRELYLKFACNRCHGVDGRGGTRGVDVGTDAWGRKAAAADLTSGMFRGGGRPIDVYRRIHSGITGSPMPGFVSQFASDPDAIWHLVHYIEDMSERRRRGLPPLEAEAQSTPAHADSTPGSADATESDAAAATEPAEPSDAAPEDAETSADGDAAADDESAVN